MGENIIKSEWEINAEQVARNINIALNDFPGYLLFCTGSKGGFALVNGHTPEIQAQLKAQIIHTLKNNPRIKALLTEVMQGLSKNYLLYFAALAF